MGSENVIRTGTTRMSKNLITNTSSNIGNAPSLLPDSVFQYGIVVGVNPVDKSIVYNAIQDNMSSQKYGPAIPLYKNKIQLPTTGSVVPLLRGPNTQVGIINKQYDKTVYYLDPIGIWQTLKDNIIDRTLALSPQSDEISINKLNIKGAEIGIPNGQ